VDVSAGWTQLKIEGEDDQPTRTYLPRKTFKATTTYTFPELRNLKVGAAVRWQSDVSMVDIVPVEQRPTGRRPDGRRRHHRQGARHAQRR
jgi:outer membrane receptor for ferric coprogen and ferric-rhodotorulic acid